MGASCITPIWGFFYLVMAKNLPYFKFITSDWLTGDITFEDLCTQGLFINICALYWQRDGRLTVEEINHRYKNPDLLKTLIGRYIKVKTGNISIKFLDEQFEETEYISKRNSENGKKGGRPKSTPKDDLKSGLHNPLEIIDLEKATALSRLDVANPLETDTKPTQSQLDIIESKVKEKESKEEENKSKLNLNKLTPAKDSIFTEMVKIWYDWFESLNSVIPKFSAKDGAKIKSIRKYLEAAISKKGELTDEKILEAWSLILQTIPKHEFVSKNLSLGIIEMKLNEIISLAIQKPNDRDNKHNQSTRGAAEILAQKHKKENEVRALGQ